MYSQNQIPLVLQRKTNQGSRFEIHHEGLQFLRNFSTKKLRIIFNISTGTNISIFSEAFMTGSISQYALSSQSNLLSILTIVRDVQVMNTDEILVMLNAHQNPNNCSYLLFAYIIASAIICHNTGQLDPKSDLITLLSGFHDNLRMTNLKQLNGQVKVTTGFDKKPYFMCLMHNVNKQNSHAKQNFLGLFKNINNNSSKQLKKSTDVILDYLSNRTALYLSSNKQLFIKDCLKIKNSFINTLIKRKLLNFEITGSTIQNLCLEFFELIQQKGESIDLISICCQVISNQKRRVYTEGVDFYIKRLAARFHSYEMPYDPAQLFEYHQKVEKEVFEYVNLMSVNCMNLEEYLSVRRDIEVKMEESFLDLEIANGKSSQQYNTTLRQEMCELQLEGLELMADQINTKLDNFTYRSKGVEDKENLSQLAKCLFQKYSSYVNAQMKNLQEDNFSKEMEIYQIKFNMQRLQEQNQELVVRYQRCIMQRQWEAKNRAQQQKDRLQYNPQTDDAQNINLLKSQIKKLEEQKLQMQVHIDDLNLKFQDYEIRFSKQKIKPKGEIAILTRQFFQCMKQFDVLYQRMGKLDEIVKSAKKQIQKQKQQIAKDRDEWLSKKQQLQQSKDHLVLNCQQYKQNAQRANQTIELYKEIVKFTKDNLEVHAHKLINQKILIAELETNAMIYQKCIELICETLKRGNKEAVIKFLNSIDNIEIRDYVIGMIEK